MLMAIRSFLFFTLERVRCALLALATIVLLKMAAITFFAPLLERTPAPTGEALAGSYARP